MDVPESRQAGDQSDCDGQETALCAFRKYLLVSPWCLWRSERGSKLPKVTLGQSQNLNIGLSGSGYSNPTLRSRISDEEAFWECLGRRALD